MHLYKYQLVINLIYKVHMNIEVLKRNVGRPVLYTYEYTLPLIENWLNAAKEKKFNKVIYDQKTSEQKTIELIKPLTIYDFCLTTGMDYRTYMDILNSDIDSDNCKHEKQLIQIITRVHELIKDNQLTGAILNEYNATIVSRMNGLNDTLNIQSNVTLNSLPLHLDNNVIDLTSAEYTIINESVNKDSLQLTE